IGLKFVAAVVGTKIEVEAVVVKLGRSIACPHLHAAYWINRVAGASTEAATILRHPPHAQPEQDEDEVQVSGVIPFKVGCGNMERVASGYSAEEIEDFLGRETRNRHDDVEKSHQA